MTAKGVCLRLDSHRSRGKGSELRRGKGGTQTTRTPCTFLCLAVMEINWYVQHGGQK